MFSLLPHPPHLQQQLTNSAAFQRKAVQSWQAKLTLQVLFFLHRSPYKALQKYLFVLLLKNPKTILGFGFRVQFFSKKIKFRFRGHHYPDTRLGCGFKFGYFRVCAFTEHDIWIRIWSTSMKRFIPVIRPIVNRIRTLRFTDP